MFTSRGTDQMDLFNLSNGLYLVFRVRERGGGEREGGGRDLAAT